MREISLLNCRKFLLYVYVYVCVVLQDGFCDGELLDGRRGLVPSNFIQKLVGDDLLEFHQSVVLNLRDVDDCNSTTIPQDLDMAAQNQDFIGEYVTSKRFYSWRAMNILVFCPAGEGVYRRTDGATYMDLEAEMLLGDDESINDPMSEGPGRYQNSYKNTFLNWQVLFYRTRIGV